MALTGVPKFMRRVRTEAAHVFSRDLRVPTAQVLDAWRHGFYAGTVRLYDFEAYGHGAYVSDAARVTKLKSINKRRYLLDDKLNFFLYLTAFGSPTPTLYGLVERGRVVLTGEHHQRGFAALLADKGKLVIKPRGGSGGIGFSVLEHRAGRVTLNGREIADPEVALGFERSTGLVISQFVQQHHYSSQIFPGTSNTIRVITMTDEAGPFVVQAGHRFGTERSKPVDNVSQGGLSAGIDVVTGVLGSATGRPVRAGDRLRWQEHHPDTGAQISGTQVPHWAQVLDEVRRTAATLPGSDFVGWDVLVTEDGLSILEGNNRPDVAVQLHGPWLRDERVRRFFRDKRVIR